MALPVDVNQALITAQKFCAKAETNNLMRKAPASAKMTLAYTAKASQSNQNSFYVFNRGEKAGFVIVAAEDRAGDIIGFTDKGDFNYSIIPCNMKAWLDEYSRQIDFIIANPGIAKASKRKAFDKNLEPLLGEIIWDQGSPYNDKCPLLGGGYSSEHCAVGCVATALGQVMYYNRWPEKGVGSHSYVDPGTGETRSADFGSTTYKWDDMLPYLTDDSPAAAKDAVSTLLYHVGVGVNMQYGSSSGAYSTDEAIALINYFNYDKGSRYLARDYYGASEWEKIVLNSLDNGHAVIYNGATKNNEGHCFVCDGYNTEGYFHINWGWSGISNGYFLLSALDPELQGTGGSSGNLAFNYYQDMVVNIQKAQEGSETFYEFYADALGKNRTKDLRSKPIKLVAKNVCNYSTGPAVVSLDYVVINKDSQVVARTTSSAETIEALDGYKSFERSLQLPDSLKEGKYKAFLIFDKKNSKEDHKVRFPASTSKYFTINLTADSAFISDEGGTNLSVTKMTFNPDTIEAKKSSTITATVSNAEDEVDGFVYFTITNTKDASTVVHSKKKPVSFYGKGTVDLTFKQTIDVPGGKNYKLAFYFQTSQMGFDGINISADTTICINGKPKDSKLSLYAPAYFDNHETVIPKNKIVLYAPIQNDGGDYKGKIVANISENSYVVAAIDTVDVSIPEGESKVITFTGKYLDGKVGNAYRTAFVDLTKQYGWLSPTSNAYIDFTLGDDVNDAIKNAVTDNSVSISMREGTIFISTENKLLSAEVYSAAGQMVNKSLFSNSVNMNNTPSGIYMIVVKTDKGVKITKIMK
jgi:hypothetical protein